MENNKDDGIKLKAIQEILESDKTIKFLLDTNVILAYLNAKNDFHLEAKTSIDALVLKDVWFIIPHLVMGEFIAHRNLLGKGNYSVNKALDNFSNFREKLKNTLLGGPPLNAKIIIDFYKKHSKYKKLTASGFADFMILVQAETINNIRVLTCDKKMYDCSKSIFKKRIYYLPSRTKKIKSDYPRLMLEIQQGF